MSISMFLLLLQVPDFIFASLQEKSLKNDGRDVKNGVNHDENVKLKDENMFVTQFGYAEFNGNICLGI